MPGDPHEWDDGCWGEVEDLAKEIKRLRGLIAALVCENGALMPDCAMEMPDMYDHWCPVCQAKAAAKPE